MLFILFKKKEKRRRSHISGEERKESERGGEK
jgi:hypothetical protein